MTSEEKSLQEEYAPTSICFGCGPANKEGLHIRSFAEADKVVATWNALPKYQAFPGVLNGGIIGSLLDCHSNWTAAWHIKKENKFPKWLNVAFGYGAYGMLGGTYNNFVVQDENGNVLKFEGKGVIILAWMLILQG